MEGVDYAWGRPSYAELARLGKRFACRYLSYDTTGKNLSLAEAQTLTAAGLSVVCVWEWYVQDALGGYARGREHAFKADAQLKAYGGPANGVIYFAVDFDATDSQLVTCAAYLDGAASVIGRDRVGVYGGYRTIDYMHRNGKAKWFWQTYAWSYGRWHSACHIQQYQNGVYLAGVNLDLNRAIDGYFGQWKTGQSVGEEIDMTPMQDATLNGISERTAVTLTLLGNVAAKLDRVATLLETVASKPVPVNAEVSLSPATVQALREEIGNEVAERMAS